MAKGTHSTGLVVFCGAGVSVAPPSSLPAAFKLRSNIIRELASPLLPSNALTDALNCLDESDFPLEFVLEVLVARFGAHSLEALYPLRSGSPNAVHRAIATMATNGKLTTIVTVNFDSLIERALEDIGCRSDVHYKVYVGVPTSLPPPAPLPLIKLHGTIDNPNSLVATISQIGSSRNHSNAIKTLFEKLSTHRWIFTGYRGADYDLSLAIKTIISTANGIWNSFKTTEIEPWVKNDLERFNWEIRNLSAEALFKDLLDGHHLSPPTGTVTHYSATSIMPPDWHAAYGDNLRAKSISDMLSHVGSYKKMYSFLTCHLKKSRSPYPGLLVSKVEACLALGRLDSAGMVLGRIARELRKSSKTKITRVDHNMEIELQLSQSKWLWQIGHYLESINTLNGLLCHYRRGNITLTVHQKVRLLTYLGERMAESGNGRKAKSLCDEAISESGDHVQLQAVARRTLAHSLICLGKYEEAVVELLHSLPDLVADINGKLIALQLLCRGYLFLGDVFEAEETLKEMRNLLLATDHVPRHKEYLYLQARLKSIKSSI